MGSIGFREIVLVLFAVFVCLIHLIPACRIASRVGYPAWLGVGMLFPIVNIILLWLLAFAPWPGEKERTEPAS